MNETKVNKNWYVLYTHPRAEFKVERSLRMRELEVFLPVKKIIKQWSDRKKVITSPLFTSYIFIYADEKERLLSLEDKLVVRCLTNGRKPAVVPVWQIESIKMMLQRNTEPEVFEGLVHGDKIQITNGPLKGITGIIINADNRTQLAISIELINRTVIVHLSDEISFTKV
ncbi:MAG: UpxY family transcription antiterminator [Ignavibacteriaceae bacterium]|jgi:transcription antitermination factor NusG|nr:UpxY family transcription antiterminator [Ignavibacteriaceae bacterium]